MTRILYTYEANEEQFAAAMIEALDCRESIWSAYAKVDLETGTRPEGLLLKITIEVTSTSEMIAGTLQ